MPVVESGTPINMTATGDVTTKNGVLIGFFCASTNAGTMILRKSGGSGTVISGTITPAAATFYRFPSAIPEGLHVTIGGTALEVTFFIEEGFA